MNGYMLGIDLGTSSCKTVLFTLNGTDICEAVMEYDTFYGSRGEAEQDPGGWWSAVCTTVKSVLEKSGITASEICAIGIDTQSSALIPLNDDGDVLHPALIWSDRRAVRQQDWLNENVNADRQLQVNGNLFDASNVGTKALWWKEEHPGEYDKTAVLLNACGYITYMFTGKYSCNMSEADLSQLSDQKKGTWSKELIDMYGLRESLFPPIYSGDEILGTVTEAAAEATGLCSGTPVTAGAMDVCATAFGSGVAELSDAVITGGTVTGLALCSENFVIQNTSHVYHHMIRDKWIYCASVDFGGGSMRWFRDEFMDHSDGNKNLYSVMDDMAADIPAGSEGLIFMPYMTGQRCPEWDGNMTGVFFGLRPNHTKAHCIRAIMEGTAFGLKKIADMYAADGLVIRNITVAGGCSKSDVWMDIFSQVLQKDRLYRASSNNLAVFGASLGAGISVGIYRDPEEALSCCRTTALEYGEYGRDRYERLEKLFVTLYPSLKGAFRELRDIYEND